MANLNEAVDALLYQVRSFVTNYVTAFSHDDIQTSTTWHIEPFNISDSESLKRLLGVSNYCFVVTNCDLSSTRDKPISYLRNELNAYIYVIRKTLFKQSVASKGSLLLSGGSDGAGSDITSMNKVCGDLAKHFSDFTKGCKLLDATSTENAVYSEIVSVSNLEESGEFAYKVLRFRALTMETITIS